MMKYLKIVNKIETQKIIAKEIMEKFFYQKMPKIETLDALEEHEEHEDDYQTNSN